jgi:hypothetical protein
MLLSVRLRAGDRNERLVDAVLTRPVSAGRVLALLRGDYAEPTLELAMRGEQGSSLGSAAL